MLEFKKICEALGFTEGYEATQIKYNTTKLELEERWKISKKGNRYYTDKEGTLYVITEIKCSGIKGSHHSAVYRCTFFVKDKDGNSGFTEIVSASQEPLFSEFYFYALQVELFGIDYNITNKKFISIHDKGKALINTAISNQSHNTSKLLLELSMKEIDIVNSIVSVKIYDIIRNQTVEKMMYHRHRSLRCFYATSENWKEDTTTVFILCAMADSISNLLKLNNQDEEDKCTLKDWLGVCEGYLKLV